MGMAASQARYLALTARKTNAEYEGQQINQARTALANQSANLFNRLLGMDVPNPPKTSDYTTIQYSYSDGENESVIDDWKQLSGVNPDYNYIVNTHYLASLYTGSMKQLADPQVQVSGTGSSFDWDRIRFAKNDLDSKTQDQENKYTDYQNIKRSEESCISLIQVQARLNNDAHSHISSDIHEITVDNNNTYILKDSTGQLICTVSNANTNTNAICQGVYDMLETNLMDLSTLNTYLAGAGKPILLEDDIDKILYDSYTQGNILDCFGLESDGNTKRIVAMEDIRRICNDADNTGNTAHTHSLSGTFLEDPSVTPPIQRLNDLAEEIRTDHKSQITIAQQDYINAYNAYIIAMDAYNNTLRPTYIGNSELTPLINLTADQKTELLQVVKDMNAQGIDTAITSCFDTAQDPAAYLGGIYSFKMNGTTYYTTLADLEDAYFNSYPENGSNNTIDNQYKMPYFNASYIDTRIEKECRALLETDSNGRFKSVRFEDDSVVYNLNTETVTDEAAYDDAMNQYLYEKEKYEKTIADINAQTSIIQKEDRTLELRLKQLETEQNAVKTEIDAVKKVIKDNIESTFKTFSD